MNKCLKIIFSGGISISFLRSFVQKHARNLKIEGMAQVMSDETVRVIACDSKDSIDAFLDELHKGTNKVFLDDIQVEPFVKDKDYRGIFRVIE